MKKILIQFVVFQPIITGDKLQYDYIDDGNLSVRIIVEVDGKLILNTTIKPNNRVGEMIKKLTVLDIKKNVSIERINFFELSRSDFKLKREENYFDSLVLESNDLEDKILDEITSYVGDVDISYFFISSNNVIPHHSSILCFWE